MKALTLAKTRCLKLWHRLNASDADRIAAVLAVCSSLALFALIAGPLIAVALYSWTAAVFFTVRSLINQSDKEAARE